MTLKRICSVGLTMLLAILGFVAGCSNRTPDTIRAGYIPIADCAQLYVAIEKGYFQDENLRVELTKLAGGAKILEALAGGSVEVGFSNLVSLILAKNAGLDFVAITGGPFEDSSHAEHGILVLTGSPISSVSELRGKKIALNTRKNIDELYVVELLEKHGVDIQKIQFVEVPFPRMQNVLELGEVDAAAAIEPFVTFALKSGRARVLSYNYVELHARTQISAYVAASRWLTQSNESAARYAKAISRATQYTLANPEEVRSIVAKYASLTDEQIKGVVLPSFSERVEISDLQSLADRVFRRGWASQAVDARQVVYSFGE